ncbi:MAG: glycosyltransferase [archaeon]|nr:glycosyltransferase [archaeon]
MSWSSHAKNQLRRCLVWLSGSVVLFLRLQSLGQLAYSVGTLEYLALPSFPFALGVFCLQIFFFLSQAPLCLTHILWLVGRFGFNEPGTEPIRPGFSPSHATPVDVIIFTCRDPLAVIERTLEATLQIDWPPHLLNVYLADDGGDPTVQQLVNRAARDHPEISRIFYCSRALRASAKAGNLQFAIGTSAQHGGGSELVLTLDADMAPDACILKELVPYFHLPRASTGQKPLGFVQPPQFFVNVPEVDWLARSQLFYHVLLQRFYNQWGYALWSGSNALFSRSALSPTILQQLTSGSSIVEDTLATILIHNAGFSSVYHDLVVARGLAPMSLLGLTAQCLRIFTGGFQNLLLTRCLTNLPSPISLMSWWRSFWLVIFPLSRVIPALSITWQLIRLLGPAFLAPAVGLVSASGGPFKLSHPWVSWISYELYFLLINWEFRVEQWARVRFDHAMAWIPWIAIPRALTSVVFRAPSTWLLLRSSLLTSAEYWLLTLGVVTPIVGSALALYHQDPTSLLIFLPLSISVFSLLIEWWRLTFSRRVDPISLQDIIPHRNNPSRRHPASQTHTPWYSGFEHLTIACLGMLLYSCYDACSPT